MKTPYHFVALDDSEFQKIRDGYLTSLPGIIKSLSHIPGFFERFIERYDEISTIDRKNRRIGITGDREKKSEFFKNIDQAVKEIQDKVKRRTGQKISKQAVFWMVSEKLKKNSHIH